MDGTCRAFVGIALPESYQRELAAIRDRLRPFAPGPMTWTRPGNWHLTLKFLGDVPLVGPSGLEAVKAALAGVDFTPFRLSGAGGGFFPNAKRPRVLWVGLAEGGAACVGLAAAVETALSPLGFSGEDRPFAAHLTLARIREPGRAAISDALLRELAAIRLPEIVAKEVTLWRSIMQPSGPRYEVLATVPGGRGERPCFRPPRRFGL